MAVENRENIKNKNETEGDEMIEVKELAEENLADVEKVIRTRFGENGVAVVRAFMRNPVRKDWPAAGYLAFCDGVPQAFEGFTLRRMFLAGEPIVGKVGGLTCAVPGADETAYVEVRLQNNRSYAGCVVFFGNSQNANTAFLTRKDKNAHPGSESCSRYLWRAVRPFDCLAYFLRRKVLKKDIPDWPAFDTLRSRDFSGRVVEEFPSFVQPLLKRYLPHERRVGNNAFSWSCAKPLRERLEAVVDTPKSWFFGPYDGDLVM